MSTDDRGTSTPDPDPDPDDRREAPEQSADDTAAGWGDEARGDAEAERDAWLLDQRPPHHG